MKSHLIDELQELIENIDSVEESHKRINEYLNEFLYHPLQDEWNDLGGKGQKDLVFLLKYPNNPESIHDALDLED